MSYAIDVYRGDARPDAPLARLRAVRGVLPASGRRARSSARGELEQQIASRARARREVRARLALLRARAWRRSPARRQPRSTSPTRPSPRRRPLALDAWLGVLGYAFQIYFDFSGYSDMAIGLALMLGFELPQNFDSPYRRASITDFWRRWHITLSSWLRDYLYIPLGGNAAGARGRTQPDADDAARRAVARRGWNFVLWGGIHGGMLAFERALRGPRARGSTPTSGGVALPLATFLVVTLDLDSVPRARCRDRRPDARRPLPASAPRTRSRRRRCCSPTLRCLRRWPGSTGSATGRWSNGSAVSAAPGRSARWPRASSRSSSAPEATNVPSSISSSDPIGGDTAFRRMPRIDARVPLVVLALLAALIATMELRLAAHGIRPTAVDSEALWVRERARASRLGDRAVILVGASRIQTGIDLDVLRARTGLAPVQLAIDGSSFVPVLDGLARDPSIRGTVIVGFIDSSLDEPRNAGATADRYEARFEATDDWTTTFSFDTIEGGLTDAVRSRLRSYADGARPLTSLRTRILSDASPQYAIFLADRSRLADYSQLDRRVTYYSRVVRELDSRISFPAGTDFREVETDLAQRIDALEPAASGGLRAQCGGGRRGRSEDRGARRTRLFRRDADPGADDANGGKTPSARGLLGPLRRRAERARGAFRGRAGDEGDCRAGRLAHRLPRPRRAHQRDARRAREVAPAQRAARSAAMRSSIGGWLMNSRADAALAGDAERLDRLGQRRLRRRCRPAAAAPRSSSRGRPAARRRRRRGTRASARTT